MLGGTAGSGKQNALLAEYSTQLVRSMLHHRAWLAEQTAHAETQLASRHKSEFMATISHELRTPLNSVLGFAKLLSEHQRRDLRDGEIVEYAELIAAAATHLLCVITDVSDICRIESGKYALDAHQVNLDDVLQVALASLRPTAFEAGVALEGHFDKDLPSVTGDEGKLRTVFSNLIGNAVRFTPRGGAVRVECRTLADGGVAVHVRDTGIGMTQEEIALALTPFAQTDAQADAQTDAQADARTDAGRTRWREGTGLGLPIAKALVQLHGGEVEIASSPAQGTEVRVILPCTPRPQVADQLHSLKQVGSNGAP
jgi:two-component system cell cycle sensor histidine kinase PleC